MTIISYFNGLKNLGVAFFASPSSKFQKKNDKIEKFQLSK